jgi:hypothetical protein
MGSILVRRTGFGLLATLAFLGASCATKRASSPPPTPAPQTYEQGITTDEQAAPSASSQSGSTSSSQGSSSDGDGSKGSGETSADPSSSGDSAQSGEEAGEQGAPGGSGSPTGNEGEAGSGLPPGSASTPGERRSGVDRRLDESLQEFEDRLARERERLTSEISGEGIAGGSKSTGGDSDSAGEGGPGDPAGDSSKRRSPGASSGVTGADPPNIPDGRDDDVVARQLRELAENEKDPDKRAIYWQDYLDYKSGRRKSSGRHDGGGKAGEQPKEKNDGDDSADESGEDSDGSPGEP